MDQDQFQSSVLSQLDVIQKAVSAVAAAAVPVPAYDRPVITDPSQVVPDERTVNKDGSVWAMSTGFGPGQVGAQHPTPKWFGYISPVKTPEIWAFLKANMTAGDFTTWETAWKARRYAIYGADIRAMIANGSLNIVTFHLIMQPLMDYVQD